MQSEHGFTESVLQKAKEHGKNLTYVIHICNINHKKSNNISTDEN